MIDFIKHIALRLTDAALLLAIVAVVWSLYRVHLGPQDFNLLDILMENGRVSKWNCIIMGAFAITSWQMVRLTLDGKLTEGYLGVYMGAWVAPLIARMFAPAPLKQEGTL